MQVLRDTFDIFFVDMALYVAYDYLRKLYQFNVDVRRIEKIQYERWYKLT